MQKRHTYRLSRQTSLLFLKKRVLESRAFNTMPNEYGCCSDYAVIKSDI